MHHLIRALYICVHGGTYSDHPQPCPTQFFVFKVFSLLQFTILKPFLITKVVAPICSFKTAIQDQTPAFALPSPEQRSSCKRQFQNGMGFLEGCIATRVKLWTLGKRTRGHERRLYIPFRLAAVTGYTTTYRIQYAFRDYPS